MVDLRWHEQICLAPSVKVIVTIVAIIFILSCHICWYWKIGHVMYVGIRQQSVGAYIYIYIYTSFALSTDTSKISKTSNIYIYISCHTYIWYLNKIWLCLCGLWHHDGWCLFQVSLYDSTWALWLSLKHLFVTESASVLPLHLVCGFAHAEQRLRSLASGWRVPGPHNVVHILAQLILTQHGYQGSEAMHKEVL